MTRGRRLISNAENAKNLFKKAKKRAISKFSRKKSTRYAAKITLRWKTHTGKWVSIPIVKVSSSLDRAIEMVLEDSALTSLTSEDKDDNVYNIESKTKRIVDVRFDKYVKKTERQKRHGALSKTSRKKGATKKSRRLRH